MKVKYVLMIILAVSTIWSLYSQSATINGSRDTTFIVVKVNGKVWLMPDSIRIGMEDEWRTKDQLTFSSIEDYLIVVDKKKQEPYKVLPKEDLKSFLIIPSKVLTNTRPGAINNYAQLRMWLFKRQFLVLGPTSELAIGEGEFEVDADHFFILRYDWHHHHKTEEVNKKLPFHNQKLVFSKPEIFKVDGNAIAIENTSNFQLYFYDDKVEEALKIGAINLLWIDEEQLKTELEAMISALNIKKKNQYERILSYIQFTYGEPESENLNNWLKIHLGIVK